MFLKLSALLFLAVAATAVPVPDGRIVGGHAVQVESFPYQAAMLYRGQHICGGSIIGPKYILTAAHCTAGMSASALSVRVGSTYHSFGGDVLQVVKIIQHELYDSNTYDNDISILVLDWDVSYNDAAQPVPLAEREPATGTWCDVTGWGALWENGEQPSNLQLVQVPALSRDGCQAMYQNNKITGNMICAGFADGEKDACQGDSGGPLAVEGVQVGVVSWGVGCARPSKPGVYTNVAAMRPWIKNQIAI